MPGFIQHKICWMGVALQTAQGSIESQPTVVFPISEEAAIGVDHHFNFFQYADGYLSGPRHWYSGGSWSTGTLRFPIVPGMLTAAGCAGGMETGVVTPAGDISDIGRWAFMRQHTYASMDNYGQGLFATVFRHMGHVSELYGDVKVASGKISVSFGQMAMLDLELIGLRAPVSWSSPNRGSADDTAVTTTPYHFNNAAISIDDASDILTNDHSLSFDNMLASVDEAATLNGQVYPTYLPNGECAQWTGTFSRHFHDSTLYTKFVTKTEAAYKLVMTASGYVATLEFPRIIYTEAPLSIPSTGFLKQDGISFQALASADGSTAAWNLIETTS